MCESLNTEMLLRIDTDEIKLIANDSIECPKYLQTKVKNQIKTDDEDCSRSGGLPKIITVKIGAKVMITKNIDVSLGLVNGTIATISSVSRNINNKNDIEKLSITLSSKEQYIIERANVKFQLMDKAFIIRKQFPITLSYAITVHKSQGLSLKVAVVDAGNTMFSNGQIYVALSRVTSLDGLHLINFDPSSLKASKDAIKEYNRLKRKYRPDLSEYNVHSHNFGKVNDNYWTAKMQINQTCEQEHNSSKSKLLHGIDNVDGNSCYANSVIQCIFNCKYLADIILKLPKENVLCKNIHDYLQNKTIDVLSIRHYAGEQFIVAQQQDAAEFLNNIIQQTEDIKSTVQYKIRYTHTCINTTCTYTNSNEEINFILSLSVKGNFKNNITLQCLIDSEINKKEQISETCDNCSHKNKLRKREIISSGKIVILQLKLFVINNDNLKSIRKQICNIKSIPSSTLKISGNLYNVVSSIFHHGTTTKHGHYTCMVRNGKGWVQADDNNVTKKNWPRNGKDAYLFILQKVN